VARAREVPEIDCEEPFARAASRVVEVRANEVLEHSAGVLDLAEVERVHDMRVATRRLRAALEVFSPCFPRKRHRKALKRVKELADGLGERRDRDVAIGFLEALVAELGVEEDRAALVAKIDELRVEQRRANEELAPLVANERLAKLGRSLGKLVEAAEG
jgi:CHAD domain-containing protein